VLAILGTEAVRKMRELLLPKKRELKEHVLRRARKLAESGRFEERKALNLSCGFSRDLQRLAFG
jgi:hypothetical protein